VDLAGAMRGWGHGAGGLADGADDHRSPDPRCGCPAHGRARRRRRGRDMASRSRARWGRAAAMETAGTASQILADCNPEVYDEGILVPRGRPGRPARPYRTRRHCAGIRGARHRVMAWPAAGYGVVAAGGRRGEEDEQAEY
jgi:hypothetical protein